jgi:hypothetical protein
VHASVPYEHDQHVLKGPFQIWNFYAYAEHWHDLYAQGTHQIMMRMLSESEGTFPDPYAQGSSS